MISRGAIDPILARKLMC